MLSCMSQIGGAALFPGAGFFELAAASQRSALTIEADVPTAVVEASISAPFRLPTTSQPSVMLCCELDPSTGSFTALSQGGQDEHATLHMASSSWQTAHERILTGSSTIRRAAEGLASQDAVLLAGVLRGRLGYAPRTALAEVGQPRAGRADGYRVHPAALDSGLQLGQLCLDPLADGEGASPHNLLTSSRRWVRVLSVVSVVVDHHARCAQASVCPAASRRM